MSPSLRTASQKVEKGIFFKRWLKNPLSLGAVLPSSRALANFVADCVLDTIGTSLDQNKMVVEIGAGTGSFTDALIQKGIPKKQLISVEKDAVLFSYLKERFPDITTICGDAQLLHELIPAPFKKRIAAVISSIPIVTLNQEVCQNILSSSFSLLGTQGTFFQFTYTPFSSISARKFSLTKRRLGMVLRNIPPATVWSYQKSPHTYTPNPLENCVRT